MGIPESAVSLCLQLGGIKIRPARTIETILRSFCLAFRAFVSIIGGFQSKISFEAQVEKKNREWPF